MNFFFNLAPFAILIPLLMFAVIILFTNPNNRLSSGLAIGGIAISTVISWGIVLATILSGERVWEETWQMSISWLPTGTSVLKIGLEVDSLTAAMLFMVPFVCMVIFIYSQGYMNLGKSNQDPLYARFFAYMSLFAAGMIGLVLSGSLVLLFIFWEIMGLCSYLLIGFWSLRDRDTEDHIDEAQVKRARAAGLKAFLTTRIGDVLLFSGMLLLWAYTGTLTFSEIFQPEVLERLTETTVWGLPAATVIALLVFGGAVGKSAQFPLHVWLPDAMEGPTPVSALIHAATMVAAGVYLVARTYPLFAVGSEAGGGSVLAVVAVIGAITAFFGATIGLAQDDIKRVLAYSTISQLGYMMMALGLGGLVAAVFHLLAHAFFKALLFLGSGSVIHGVEHGHHEVAHHSDHHGDDDFNPNDMKTMGGLRHKMPRTFWPYIIGTLALVGWFPFAGFWSKDEILAEAFHLWRQSGTFSLPLWVWLAGTLGALITALYMGRQIGLVFYGEPRHEAAGHAHESPHSMTTPLIVLAIFAVIGGLANLPSNVPLVGGELHHFIGEVHEASEAVHSEALPLDFTVAGLSTVLAVFGLLFGWAVYRNYRVGEVEPFQRWLGPIFTLLKNKYYVDELYQAIFIRPTVWLADLSFKFDKGVIDYFVDLVGKIGRVVADISGIFDEKVIDSTLVDGTGEVTNSFGGWLRHTQTGRVQNYVLVIAVTVLLLLGLYLYL
jgi:NADH-quinone oxidoreductase subunit L